MNINKKEHINIVWFKRDLRLQDNEAVYNAMTSNRPVLLVYIFENSLKNDPHYSARHWRFIKQSLADLNQKLLPYDTKILTLSSEVVPAFRMLQQCCKIDTVFSHRETGIRKTFERDKLFRKFCKNNLITWKENDNNGIQRGLKDRKLWNKECEKYLTQPQFEFDATSEKFISLETISKLEKHFTIQDIRVFGISNFQNGGSSMAMKYLNSFFDKGRYKNYSFHISKPDLSRKACSRLSPYLAWGNVSIRQVYQYAKEFRKISGNKKQIDAFTSRLRWQIHFVQ